MENVRLSPRRMPVGDTALKVFACVAMLIEHIPYIFGDAAKANYYYFPDCVLHAVGRFTAPIFFYMLAKGYSRTRNVNRYTARLLIFAVVSYVPFIYFFRGSLPNGENFLHLNTIFTMLLGLLMLRSLEEIKNLLLKVLCVSVLFFISCFADQGFWGMLFILCFYYLSENGAQLTVGYSCLIGTNAFNLLLRKIDGQDLSFIKSVIRANWFWGMFAVSFAYFIPLFFILANKKHPVQKKHPRAFLRWFFYAFYPAHFIVLLFVKFYMTKG
jgi:hypothetical protein